MTLRYEPILTLRSVLSSSIDDATIAQIAEVARASFGRPTDSDMFEDTCQHIRESEVTAIAYDGDRIVGVSMARVVDDTVFNWMGCMIDPDYQKYRLGPRFMAYHRDEFRRYTLVGHTRTPRMLQLLYRHSVRLYPIHNDSDLLEIACGMKDVSYIGGVAYQLHRYYYDGLYGQADPADEPFGDDDHPLRVRFPGLQNPRNAVIVVAQLR